MPAGTRWHVCLLGGLQARNGDVRIDRWPSRVGALLALLALDPDHPQPRERLAGALWPDAAPAEAANRFRNALSRLKTLLEPPGVAAGSVIEADRRQVRLQPDAVWCDAAEFERLARQGRAALARSLYAGELLPGLYDDWVVERRAALAALAERLDGAAEPAAHDTSLRLLRSWGTPLVGREAECAALLALVARERLVTLTGQGGCGKSRLAGEVAARVGGFQLVAWVALEACESRPEAEHRLRAVLELPAPPPGQAALQPVLYRLRGQRALLVLDNFEQFVDTPAAQLAAELLRALPQLHLLLTSRAATRLPGEQALALPPLAVPAPDADLAGVSASPAVRLFTEQARQSRDEFRVNRGNAGVLGRLCRAVHGLPLALLMAASLVRVQPLDELAEMLEARPSLLAGRARRAAADPRRHSLRTVLATSLRLLDAPAARQLRRLAAFRGSFDAAQAAAVAALDDARAPLDTLLRHSLLQAEGGGRFSLSPVLRELLRETLPRHDAGERRHREVFAALAEGVDARCDNACVDDLPNLQQALATTVAAGQPVPPALLGVLTRTLLQAARPDEALAACAAAAGVAAEPADVLEAEIVTAWVRWCCTPDPMAHAVPVMALLARARAGARPRALARVARLAAALQMRGPPDLAGAAARLDEAEAVLRATGEAAGLLVVDTDRVAWLMRAGRLDEACALAERTLAQAAGHGLVETQALLLNRLGLCQGERGRHAEALQSHRRLARLARDHGLHYHLAYALWNLVAPLVHEGRADEAGRLLGFARPWWEQRFGPLTADDRRDLRGLMALGRRRLGRDAWDAALAAGAALSQTEAVALACG